MSLDPSTGEAFPAGRLLCNKRGHVWRDGAHPEGPCSRCGGFPGATLMEIVNRQLRWLYREPVKEVSFGKEPFRGWTTWMP